MTKSWGARIVGRLFGSRSHKQANAERNETPSLEDPVKDSLLQHDSEPYEALSTRDSDVFSDQIRPEIGDEPALTKGASKAQLNVSKLDTLERPTLSVPPPKEYADEPATPLSNSTSLQKPSSVRVSKSQSERLADKALEVLDGRPTGEASDGKSVGSNDRWMQKLDHGAQRKVNSTVPEKRPSKADIKPEYPAEELVTADDTVMGLKLSRNQGLLNVGQGSGKNSVVPIASTSPLKRFRRQKTKVMDQHVSDEELAELEAENARLKFLLQQKQDAM